MGERDERHITGSVEHRHSIVGQLLADSEDTLDLAEPVDLDALPMPEDTIQTSVDTQKDVKAHQGQY